MSADQRGHGIGVALDVYAHSSIEARRAAADRLEAAVLFDPKGPDSVAADSEESEEKPSEAA